MFIQNNEKTNKDDDYDDDDSHDEYFDVSDTDFEILCKAWAVSFADRSETTQNVQLSPPHEEPALLAAVYAPVESSPSTRSQCPLYQPIKDVGNSVTVTIMTSSSTESVNAEDEANELNVDDVITADTIDTSPCCTISVDSGLNKIRRCFSGGIYDVAMEVENRWRPLSVSDAQVQCDDGNVVVDHILYSSDLGNYQLQLSQL